MRIVLVLLLLILISCGTTPEKLEDLPEGHPVFEIITGNGDVFDGYIFLRKITAPGAQLMINSKGEIVWYLASDTALFRPFTHQATKYLALHSDREIFEISFDKDTLLHLKYGQNGFERTLHHEITYDQDGNILALTKEELVVDLSSFGGASNDTILTDGIIKLDRTGTKIWHWSIDQVIDPQTDSTVVRSKKDWGHANALAVDVDGNYLISWRNFNEIWKINSKTGELIWKYGESNITNKQERFYGQHAIHRTADNTYLLFDNGDRRQRATSRAIEFVEENGDFQQVHRVELVDSLFSFKQGSVYKVKNDSYLFSSTMTHTIAITNDKGDIIWMVKSDTPFYRAEYIEEL